jgi:DNA-binding CsgD family transcriptional regulator
MQSSDNVIVSLMGTLRQIQKAVPFAEGSALAMDPEVLLPTQFAATFTFDRDIALLACRNEQRDDDVLKFRDLATRENPVATLSTDLDPECVTSPRWQQLLLPRGRRHELRAALVDVRGVCWGALALYRTRGNRFTPPEVGTVRRTVPDHAARLARSMVAQRAPGSPEAPTSLMMTESGHILGASDAATQWMTALRRADEVDRVSMLLASLAAMVERRRSRNISERVQVRMRSTGGAWTTLIAEPIKSVEVGAVSVVIMPSDSTQLLPLQLAAYGLSEREKEVVTHVLDGLDTRGIATRLSISPLTVQDHLKSIFKKTEVTSRRELTHRLGALSDGRATVSDPPSAFSRRVDGV